MDALQLLLSVDATLLTAAIVGGVKLFWNHEKRITRVEDKVGIEPLES
jgi:hypothetical protein